MITATSNYLSAEARLRNKPVCILTIAGYSRVFTTRTGINNPWITDISTQKNSVDDLEGSGQLGDLTITVLDRQGLLTADLASNTLEGKAVTLQVGFDGLADGDFTTMFTGVVDHVNGGDSNNTYDIVCQDSGRLAKAVVYSVADDNQQTSTDHHKTIVGHPLDILLDVLLNQVGLAAGLVDSATVINYRDQIYPGLTFEFTLTTAPEAKQFIERELLKPLGMYGYTSAAGKYTICGLTPLPGGIVSVLTLDEKSIIDVPVPTQADLINVVTIRFDSDGSDFRAEDVEKYGASITLYGEQGQQIIESQGLRSGFQGFSLANRVSRSIFNRYGSKNPRLTLKTFWLAARLEIGDFVTVNHRNLPNRKLGVVGTTGALFQVKNVMRSYVDGVVTLEVADASAMASFGAYKVAPTSHVDYTASTTLDKGKYMFVSSDSTKQYSNGDAGHKLA